MTFGLNGKGLRVEGRTNFDRLLFGVPGVVMFIGRLSLSWIESCFFVNFPTELKTF
jgi:hypothetical protein